MRVLILWADSFSDNLGVRVLEDGARRLAEASFGSDVRCDAMDWFSPGPVRPSAVTILRDLKSRGRMLAAEFARYDVVLDTCAGDSFSDLYGTKRLAYELYMQDVLDRCAVPRIFAPQTVGPFASPINRRLASRSMRNAALVMTRDSYSAAYARDLQPAANILSSTDLVFFLEPSESIAPIHKSQLAIVNVSGLLWTNPKSELRTKFQDGMERTCRLLLSQGFDVKLLAHVVGERAQNDVHASRELAQRLDGAVEVVVPTSLKHARAVIAQAAVVIGGRMHASLNALSQGVPAIPWAYSRKFAPLLADLGWEHVVDLSKPVNPADETVALITTRLPELVLEAQRALEAAKRMSRSSVDAIRKMPVFASLAAQ